MYLLELVECLIRPRPWYVLLILLLLVCEELTLGAAHDVPFRGGGPRPIEPLFHVPVVACLRPTLLSYLPGMIWLPVNRHYLLRARLVVNVDVVGRRRLLCVPLGVGDKGVTLPLQHLAQLHLGRWVLSASCHLVFVGCHAIGHFLEDFLREGCPGTSFHLEEVLLIPAIRVFVRTRRRYEGSSLLLFLNEILILL